MSEKKNRLARKLDVSEAQVQYDASAENVSNGDCPHLTQKEKNKREDVKLEEAMIEEGLVMPEFMKDFKDLDFTDDFMFCATLTSNPELCKELAEMLIGRKIKRIVKLQDQKAIRITSGGKGVRFDVAIEGEDELCDIEMQNEIDLKELAKRSRYYQSVSDVDFLAKGQDYTKLKKSYIIFISTKRIFENTDLHRFTFRYICEEDNRIKLEDETEKIFLTTAGTANDIPPEMEDFMTYITEKKAKNDFTKRLDEAIEKIKAGEGWRIEYFQLKEKMSRSYNAGKSEGRKEGRKEGREEGREEGKKEGSIETLIEDYRDFGASDEQIKEKLKEKFDLDAKEAEAYLKTQKMN